MRKTTKAGLIAIAMSFSTISSSEPEASLCQRLAGEAEQIPAGEWAAAIYDPMDRLVNGRAINRSGHKLSATEERLANDPGLHEKLSVGPTETLGVERLEGTDVYRVESFQGTANCQYMAFVEASPGRPLHHLPAPFDADTCTTQYGRFGHAFGQPLFMVGGTVDMAGLARSDTVSAWQGLGAGVRVEAGVQADAETLGQLLLVGHRALQGGRSRGTGHCRRLWPEFTA